MAKAFALVSPVRSFAKSIGQRTVNRTPHVAMFSRIRSSPSRSLDNSTNAITKY
ncbi:hypothetical protein B0H12DRAFT_1134371 [Mycena haematopus]|nr:hypothetical protein B0H12DRAFT_1134371 [Mycena haematopus]